MNQPCEKLSISEASSAKHSLSVRLGGRELHDHWVKWANTANVFARVMFSDKLMTRTMSIWNTDSIFLRVRHLDIVLTTLDFSYVLFVDLFCFFHVQETSSLYGARAVLQILRQRVSRETIQVCLLSSGNDVLSFVFNENHIDNHLHKSRNCFVLLEMQVAPAKSVVK